MPISKCISSKVNVIVWLELELAYLVQHFSYYIRRTPPVTKVRNKKKTFLVVMFSGDFPNKHKNDFYND